VQLLVSVESAAEANDALAGGADIVDAKDPHTGALSRVAPQVFADIAGAVASTDRALSAALGDADDETAIEESARAYTAAGAAFVKIGFATILSPARVDSLLAAAIRGAARAGREASTVIAVAYADADRASSLDARTILDVAARRCAAGLLVDTADKTGPGLCEVMARTELMRLVQCAHRADLLVALAGKLSIDDLTYVRDIGADVAGVRTAACAGGRSGSVSADRVRLLRKRLCDQPSSAARSVSIRSAATTSTRTPSGIV
jgi:hypothetical protein